MSYIDQKNIDKALRDAQDADKAIAIKTIGYISESLDIQRPFFGKLYADLLRDMGLSFNADTLAQARSGKLDAIDGLEDAIIEAVMFYREREAIRIAVDKALADEATKKGQDAFWKGAEKFGEERDAEDRKVEQKAQLETSRLAAKEIDWEALGDQPLLAYKDVETNNKQEDRQTPSAAKPILVVDNTVRDKLQQLTEKQKISAIMNGAAALSLVLAPVNAPQNLASSATSSAISFNESGALIRIPLETKTASDCSAESPVYFIGEKFAFEHTNPATCRRLIEQAIPEIGQTVNLNERMSIQGLENGNILFAVDGRGTNEITADNYHAILEAWQMTGGEAGTPVPLSFLLAKWFLESRHGNLMQSPFSSARGMNQFVVGTWVETVHRYGDITGYNHVRDQIMAVAQRLGGNLDYAKLAKDPEIKRLHRLWTMDSHHSAIMGIMYSHHGLIELQTLLDNGEIQHPQDLEHVTGRMGYAYHFFGKNGAIEFFDAYAENPNQRVRDVVSRGVYNRNAYFFTRDVEVPNGNGGTRTVKVELTLKQFYDRLQSWGFDDREMQGLRNFERAERVDPSTLDLNIPNQPISGESHTAVIDRDAVTHVPVTGKHGYIIETFEGIRFERNDSANDDQLALTAQIPYVSFN